MNSLSFKTAQGSSNPRYQRIFLRYASSLALIFLGLGFQHFLRDGMGNATFLFVHPMIYFIAWRFGWKPAALCLVISILDVSFFLIPPYDRIYLSTADALRVLTFALSSGVGIWFIDRTSQARKVLKENQEWLRMSMLSMGEGVVATNPLGRVTFLNPVAERILGWTSSEAQDKPLDEVFRLGGPKKNLVISKDLTRETPVEFTSAPILPESSKESLGTIIIFRDVSEKVAKENNFRKIANDVPCLLWKSSLSDRGEWFNKGWLEYTGGNLSEEVQKLWVDSIHPEDQEKFTRTFAEHFTSRTKFSLQYRIKRADGEYRWITNRASPRFDEDLKFIGFIGICLDIHEHYLNLEHLTKTEERLRLAAEVSKVGIFEFNFQDNSIYTNSHHDQAYGFSKPLELWGIEQFKAHIHPDDRDWVMKGIRQAIDQRGEFELEFKIVWNDLSVHWMRLMGRVEGENGFLKRMIGTTMDITEKKLAEDTLHEALFYRDEFLSIASHELKTPLTSLKLQSQMFKRSESFSEEKVHKLLEQTDKQVTRLVRLVDDMLDISRIRTGKLSITTEKVDVAEMVREVVERMKPHFKDSGCPAPELVRLDACEIECDRMRIEQVVSNLLNNALKYGRKLPVVVSLKKTSDHLEISVQDQGIGIDFSDREKIFNRFQRAVPASEISGLGLGLYIARQILDAHQGRLLVESEINVGSTFTVELPLKKNS